MENHHIGLLDKLLLHPDASQGQHGHHTISIPSLSRAYAEAIDRVFAQMETVERHVYQVVTKRSLRMRDHLRGRCGNRTTPHLVWCFRDP